MKVKIGVAAEKIPDFWSWQIMRITKFGASHAILIIENEIFHAVSAGVCRVPFAPFLVDHWITDSVEIDVNCTREEFEIWFSKVKGIPYSYRQLLGFAVPKFMRRFFSNGRKAAICTEFVLWFLTDFMKWDEPGYEFATPKKVIDFIRSKLGAGNGDGVRSNQVDANGANLSS